MVMQKRVWNATFLLGLISLKHNVPIKTKTTVSNGARNDHLEGIYYGSCLCSNRPSCQCIAHICAYLTQ